MTPFLKLLLLLEFSTDFHETRHKCSTSQEEKNLGSGILNFGLCQNLGVPKQKFCPFFKSLLFLEFSTDFNETWHKYSTSQEEKNVVSGILHFGLCQNIRGPKAPLFLNRYLYSSQPISMKSCTNVVLVRRKKNVVSGILHFGPCQNLGV